MLYALGKLPKVVDDRTLQLAAYLSPALAPPPESCDYYTLFKSAGDRSAWKMLGNDRVGDCALAGQAHADMLWARYAEGRSLRISDAMVIHAYSQVTGYVPGDPSTDRGTSLLDALKFWRRPGIDRQRIRAFVEVDPRNLDNVKRAIDWFGCAYLGVMLPDAVLPRTVGLLPPWTCSPDGSAARQPNPHNGHCVIYAGYNARGPVAVTWGTTVQVSWAFHEAYCDECYAMVAPSWEQSAWLRTINPAFDAAALERDLAAIAG
jgi:hypothetical protein